MLSEFESSCFFTLISIEAKTQCAVRSGYFNGEKSKYRSEAASKSSA